MASLPTTGIPLAHKPTQTQQACYPLALAPDLGLALAEECEMSTEARFLEHTASCTHIEDFNT